MQTKMELLQEYVVISVFESPVSATWGSLMCPAVCVDSSPFGKTVDGETPQKFLRWNLQRLPLSRVHFLPVHPPLHFWHLQQILRHQKNVQLSIICFASPYVGCLVTCNLPWFPLRIFSGPKAIKQTNCSSPRRAKCRSTWGQVGLSRTQDPRDTMQEL